MNFQIPQGLTLEARKKGYRRGFDPKIAELNHNLALLNDIKNCIENARMKELGLSDFGDAIPDIDEVRARLNIETVKRK